MIRPATPGDIAHCLAIARGLPDYFTADALHEMAADLTRHPTYVAEVDGAVRGFATVKHKSAEVVELAWIAVYRSGRGKGVGSSLLAGLEGELREKAVKLIEVKTLDAKAGYAPYEATRRFYTKHRFVWLETIDPFPGWTAGNPCAIYVKIL